MFTPESRSSEFGSLPYSGVPVFGVFGLRSFQGVLALVDCPEERGTFVGVPGSRCLFDKYKDFASERGEFVQLDTSHAMTKELQDNAQAFPLRAGDVVSWDSRTTHANSENLSDETRCVAYVAAGPAGEENTRLKH